MAKPFNTKQEKLWAGKFGDAYVARNRTDLLLKNNIAFFCRAFARLQPIKSVIEFGSNIGLNLRALRHLFPDAKLTAVEINKIALKELKKIEPIEIYPQSILDYSAKEKYDMVLVKGLLIHIQPDFLNKVYDVLYQSSKRYIFLAEYYNPIPVSLPYQGHDNLLFKRDFAGEMMERFRDIKLLDYGFIYHKDPLFPQDDLTWFCLEKSA